MFRHRRLEAILADLRRAETPEDVARFHAEGLQQLEARFTKLRREVTIFSVIWLAGFCLGAIIFIHSFRFVVNAWPFLVSAAFALFGGWWRRSELQTDRFDDHLFVFAAIGGISGEFARYLLGAVPPGAPTSLGWRLVGAVGLGGAAGLVVWFVLCQFISTVQLWFPLTRARPNRRAA